MSRRLEDIYNEAVEARKQRLELSEVENGSKMSIMNAITWVTSSVIYSFETIMDAFTLDLVKIFNTRINGTPAYYANAMLKWQEGDELVINEDGTAFHYPQVDESKRVISHVSYQESYNSHYQDNMLILKVASGFGDKMTRLSKDQLIGATKYLNQIKFAGVKCVLVSLKGDVLVPKLTVYYDGGIPAEDLKNNIEQALAAYIDGIGFDSAVYVQKIIDAIQKVEHVTDVHIGPNQGIFLARYNEDDELEPMIKVDRKSYLSSGYVKQSTGEEQEVDLPKFKDSIILKVETQQ